MRACRHGPGVAALLAAAAIVLAAPYGVAVAMRSGVAIISIIL